MCSTEKDTSLVSIRLQKLLSEIDGLDLEARNAPDRISDVLAGTIQDICQATGASKPDRQCFGGIHSAFQDILADLPEHFEPVCREGIVFAARILLDVFAEGRSIVGVPESPAPLCGRLDEPTEKNALQDVEFTLTRLQCLEILAGAFFGIIRRGWWMCKRKYPGDRPPGDMPSFTFEKLWKFSFNTKNFVLMGVLLYFRQASQIGKEVLSSENICITRKGIGAFSVTDSAAEFCPLDLKTDGTSIHEFTGQTYLQADFANQYLGGGVLSGGGSQEEGMFVEYTELLATIFLVEAMLPHEAVEVSGMKKYVEHNMHFSRRVPRRENYCRPAYSDEARTMVAFDALCLNRHGQFTPHQQYDSAQIYRELRKCLVAVSRPTKTVHEQTTRHFVTGLWGCGAFRGDIELKAIIQWICCSITPSIDRMIFCPFDQRQVLLDRGFVSLIEKLQGKVSVRTVLSWLIDDTEYMNHWSTFKYLLKKLEDHDRALSQ